MVFFEKSFFHSMPHTKVINSDLRCWCAQVVALGFIAESVKFFRFFISPVSILKPFRAKGVFFAE